MRLKEWLYKIFYFNKQERNGVFVLFIIISCLVIIRLMLRFSFNQDTKIIIANIDEQRVEPSKKKGNGQSDSIYKEPFIENKMHEDKFVFNPNTISIEEAERLGFSKKLSKTLLNFRDKGGRFYKAEDLKKLYGLTTNFYNSIESYILIPQAEQKNFKKYDSLSTKFNFTIKKTTKQKETLELNSADSLSIVYLKGIGPAFTKRIIKYRTMLGGFHSINQLKEVYGMTDSLFIELVPQIQIDKNNITKIPINAIDFNSLRKHPYFNYSSAQAVINFKFKHGKLTEKDIKELGVFSSEKLNVILPYLQYD